MNLQHTCQLFEAKFTTVTCIPNFYYADTIGSPHHLCLLSYRFPERYTPEVLPHGNDKSFLAPNHRSSQALIFMDQNAFLQMFHVSLGV